MPVLTPLRAGRPQILYLGRDQPASLEKCFLKGFQAAGCDVCFFDITGTRELRCGDDTGLPFRLLMRLFERSVSRALSRRLSRFAEGKSFDLIFCHKNMLVPAELLRDLADRSGALLYCYHPDNPLSPHRSHSNKNTHALIPIADCYFTFLRHMLPSLKQAGARRVEYLPFAYDPDLRHPADLLDAERQQLHCPLAFVGNYAPDRAEWFQHVLDFGLALWGSGWDAAYSLDARFRQAVKGPPQYGESFCKIYSSCDIGLNIIRALQGGDGHNMRTFEAMACGGLVMSNRTTELVDLFLENEEMVCFSNPQEMREKVIHYLDHPGDRARIASAGYARVKGETYSRRAQQILQVLVQQTEKPDWVTGGSRGENGERR